MNPKVKEFKLPDGVSFNDEEQKAINALSGWMTENFESFANDLISKEEFTKSIGEQLDKVGFKAGTLDSLKKSLKEQGEILTSLKEKANTGGINLGGLEGEFNKNFVALQKAVKDQEKIVIKAVDEHNPAYIHTTVNVITTTSGAQLAEMIGNDPNLHLKRRDRQYIHDIANVSYVDEVPETYNFWEEGSEQGFIAIVAENGLKPQVKLDLVKNSVDAQKAVGYIVATDEVVKWRKKAWAAIQRLFRDKVYRDYENILTTQLIGNASSYVSTPLDGTIPAAEVTDFTALIAGILQLESLNFIPDTLVINPVDKWRLALSQTQNGMFVLPYIQNGGQFGLLGLRVITTNKVAAGTFLLGEAGTWFIEEEAPQLRTGLVNDDFLHNRFCIVGEIFFLSYVPSNNAGAWINGNFNDIKNALVQTTP